MKFKDLIKPLLVILIPLLQKFIESTVIPKLIRRTYEKFDEYANKMIEKLTDLVEKIQTTQDETKRQRHLEGFELGLRALRAIGEKLISACDILDKEVWDYTTPQVAEDEMPF